jgi:Carbohydrate-binding module 48 (Isoamylase N-terminal domain)
MIDEHDELVERAAHALRRLPWANPAATARIVAAVRARRALAPSRWTRAVEWIREPSLSMASASFLAAAALAIGFVTRGALSALDAPATDAVTAPAPAVSATTALTAAVELSRAVRAVPVPFVFDAPNATQVALVGDFNNWNATASPMRRFGKDGPWTTTVLAKPGRHVYAYQVDGTTLVADPRAPHATDLDYGGDASVLMVTIP